MLQKNHNQWQYLAVGVVAVAAALAPVAQANFVPISSPSGGELSHSRILEAVFSPGTAWVGFGPRTDGDGDSVDLANGALQAIRVDDFGLGGILNVNSSHAGSTDDQLYTGGPVTCTARVRYANYTQRFGYDAGDGFVSLFKVTGFGVSVSGSGLLDLPAGEDWQWARTGNGRTWKSEPAANSDQQDHLVTYELLGVTDGQRHFLLFWEDTTGRCDHDYNDLVVEVAAPAVPEPVSAITLVLGGALSRVRRGR